ncbi:lipoprotein [Actinorhabdospora filicis]|uniref:Lipoprotein n=1 Tax=Actinorhabdospora filicis TaxID=1785913 RepID=A0A9W6SQA9_9ACTN|nr:GDSL-type esterase/lipase family protein [Actinorhabdospora filicis]GLZ78791.1 lipoprotein [Actinorhabdospora filicis]
MRYWKTVLAAFAAVLVLTGCTATGDPAAPPVASSAPAGPKPGVPASIAALGDSITRGVNACAKLGTCDEVSWSTGARPWSHASRLQALRPDAVVRAANYAVPGAVAADLPAQAAQAAPTRPGYVTVLIGANDACQATPTEPGVLGERVGEALRLMVEAEPGAKILVASVPDLYRLWEVAHGEERARWVWSLGLCPGLLADAGDEGAQAAQRRQRVAEVVDGYNRALEEACARFSGNCRFDGGAVHEAGLELSHLSTIDFFHPGEAGQEALAEATWRAGYGW